MTAAARLFVALVTSLVLASCGPHPPPQAAANFLRDADEAVSVARAAEKAWAARKEGSALDDAARQLRKARGEAPAEAGSEAAQKLQQVQEEMSRLEFILSALTQADSVAQRLPTDAAEAAAIAAEVAPQEQGKLEMVTEWTKDVLKDVTCDLVTDQLFPDEKTEYAGQERQGPDVVQPTMQAIANKVNEEVAKVYGTAAVWLVKSQAYALSILEHAQGYTQGLNQQMSAPDSGHTRAYYFYARLCLKPPTP